MSQKISVVVLIALSCIGCGGASYMKLVPSEPEAKVYVDNVLKGTGTVSIPVEENGKVVVRVEKSGFLPWLESFYKLPNKPFLNRVDAKLEKDESYPASSESNIANVDFSQVVNKKIDEDKAWKILSSVVTSYFDVLEISDKSTAYMKTAWVSQAFNGGKVLVRTRVIVKGVSSDQLTYKIKLVSERAEVATGEKLRITDDEKFQPWEGRILKKYAELVPEFQNRLK